MGGKNGSSRKIISVDGYTLSNINELKNVFKYIAGMWLISGPSLPAFMEHVRSVKPGLKHARTVEHQ